MFPSGKRSIYGDQEQGFSFVIRANARESGGPRTLMWKRGERAARRSLF